MIKPGVHYSYQDTSALTIWLRRLLATDIVMSVVGIVSGLMEHTTLTKIATSAENSIDQEAWKLVIAEAEANDTRQLLVGSAQVVVAIVTAIVFARWIYVSVRNCHAVSRNPLTYSPGWSVGWYFVPVANLWKPFQAMRQLWNVSENPQGNADAPAPSLMGTWWLLFLGSSMAGRVAMNLSLKAKEVAELQSANAATLFADAIYIPSAVTAFILVGSIAAMQSRNLRGMGSPAGQEPDPAVTAS